MITAQTYRIRTRSPAGRLTGASKHSSGEFPAEPLSPKIIPSSSKYESTQPIFGTPSRRIKLGRPLSSIHTSTIKPACVHGSSDVALDQPPFIRGSDSSKPAPSHRISHTFHATPPALLRADRSALYLAPLLASSRLETPWSLRDKGQAGAFGSFRALLHLLSIFSLLSPLIKPGLSITAKDPSNLRPPAASL